ncbi:diguanylate cyclase [Janthinobacterium fluminis]|uniref:diguanylate cyclase n=1 Tax=Janthinobacterium fluminis TaxID=2987524 RepID=A0ABT5K2Z3_9BURK|nr:diguanylate cyclase [Janthinobacterium fluminis]MDC8759239.1 diguanylate cyclase [Janthinobacterium fluminis]
MTGEPGRTACLALLASALDAVDLGVVALDDARRVVLWNLWMERHAGLAAGTVMGQDFLTLYPELRRRRIDAAITLALRDNFPSLLSQTLNKAPFALYATAAAAARNERMQQAVAVTPLEVAGAPRHCLIQVHDVSMAVGREKLLREQTMVLRSQTFADGLTGIANRRHFDVAMEKEWRRARRNGSALSLLMIDIDHFKAYNDHYGHQRGDECLIQVAAALATLLQRPSDLLARYGGEEFAVILPETEGGAALGMAETMRAGVCGLGVPHAHNDGADPHITVSIGIATMDGAAAAGADAAALIGAADRALYVAKRAGRNRVAAQPPV